jgi:hypothetical protein
LTPTYDLYNKDAKFYPYAIKTLRLISDNSKNKIILWTSSHVLSVWRVIASLNDEGIKLHYINENPDYAVTEICDFTKKFYFDILLDDKAGFEAESDWKVIYNYILDK